LAVLPINGPLVSPPPQASHAAITFASYNIVLHSIITQVEMYLEWFEERGHGLERKSKILVIRSLTRWSRAYLVVYSWHHYWFELFNPGWFPTKMCIHWGRGLSNAEWQNKWMSEWDRPGNLYLQILSWWLLILLLASFTLFYFASFYWVSISWTFRFRKKTTPFLTWLLGRKRLITKSSVNKRP
jgi:hypothetical protein